MQLTFVLVCEADEEHLEQGRVAIRQPVRTLSVVVVSSGHRRLSVVVVSSGDEGVSPDALTVQEGDIQRRQRLAPAGEQVAHAQTEDAVRVGGARRDAHEDQLAARRQRLGLVQDSAGVVTDEGAEEPAAPWPEDRVRSRDERR